jgi:hypothetical protein
VEHAVGERDRIVDVQRCVISVAHDMLVPAGRLPVHFRSCILVLVARDVMYGGSIDRALDLHAHGGLVGWSSRCTVSNMTSCL